MIKKVSGNIVVRKYVHERLIVLMSLGLKQENTLEMGLKVILKQMSQNECSSSNS